MSCNGMTAAISDRQHNDFAEIVVRHLHLAIEDRNQVLTLQLYRLLGIRTMALQAQRVWGLGAKEVKVLVAMRVMTDAAALLESWLMGMRLFSLFGLVGVASETNGNRIRLGKIRRVAGMRVMTISAITRRSWMLNFGLFDLLPLLGVASQADLLRSCGSQYHLAALGRGMAGITLPSCERHMGELSHQLLTGRLMRIMTGEAIRLLKRLPLVRLGKRGILSIVAVDAERRSIFRQVVIKFAHPALPSLVHYMAGVASHIQCRVTTAILWNIKSYTVAAQAKIGFLVSAFGLKQLILIV